MTTPFNLLSVILLILALTANGQSSWRQLSPTPGPGTFKKIHMASNVTGRIYGDIDAVTNDGGATWQNRKETIKNQSFPTPNIGFGTSQSGNLQKTNNGGVTWTDVNSNSFIESSFVSFFNPLTGFSIGQPNMTKVISKTTDGGQNWQIMTPPGADSLMFVEIKSVSDHILYGYTTLNPGINTAKSKLYKSVNSGEGWTRLTLPNIKSISQLFFLNPDTGWVCGDSGKIARTTNGGSSWEINLLSAPVPQPAGIQFLSKVKGWAWSNGKLFSTIDGGISWNPIPAFLSQSIRTIEFVNDTVAWAIAFSTENVIGWITKTTDGGQTWQKQTNGFFERINAIDFQGGSKVWIAGSNGLLAWSKDRGKTWVRMAMDSANYFTNIQFMNRKIAYLAGGGKVFKTIDSGNTWSETVLFPGLTTANSGPAHMQFINPDTGWVITQNGLAKTTDGGSAWVSQPSIPKHSGMHLFFLSTNHGYKTEYVEHSNLARYTHISKTTDGGNTWVLCPDTNTFASTTCMYFVNNQTGWIGLSNQKILKTTNGGATFEVISPIFSLFRSFKFITPNLGYAASSYGLLMTTDGGNSWKRDNGLTEDLNSMLMRDDMPVMGVGSRGVIYLSELWQGPFTANGKLVRNSNNDCIQDANEVPLQNKILVIEPGPYFCSSKFNGTYATSVDTGYYQIKQYSSFPFLAQLEPQFCPLGNASIPLEVTGALDTIASNDFINDVKPCPFLVLNQEQAILRPCRRSLLSISIQNLGTIASDSEWIHIRFPGQIILLSASALYDYNPIDSTYRFRINPLQPFESVSILITDSVICNTQLINQTLCIKTVIPHVPNCVFSLAQGWDGADLEIASRCLNGQTRFTLHNKGAAMATTSQYQIFIDSALVYQAPFQLMANSTMTVSLPVNAPSGFVRLVVPQSANHPLSTFASAEANCSTGQSTNGLFPPPDESPLVDIECVTVTNAYDPNDKTVFPTGWGTDGNIEPGTEFKYTVRFQNTGSDTAFKVVLVDTLDEDLDIASLQIGISSHNFSFKVSGKGRPVLTWTFDNILLPDSGRNQEASNGFVNFSIRPKTGLALGTRLENFADIYFDFNDPVRTNTTVNTLWQPTYTPGILDTVFVTATKTPIVGKDLSIFPNPTKGKVNVVTAATASICVFNSNGAMVLRRNLETGSNEVDLSSLSRGLYLIQLNGSGGKQQTKIVLE